MVNKWNRIGVYGTLKKGFSNWYHYLADSKSAKFQGTVWLPDYAMFHIGGCPAIAPLEGGKVHVEIYDVDDFTLAALDRLEGCDVTKPGKGMYDRVEINSHLFGKYWCYVMQLDDCVQFSNGYWIPKGMWEGPGTFKIKWLGEDKEKQILQGLKAPQSAPTTPYVPHPTKDFNRLNPENFGIKVTEAPVTEKAG